jgi:peroxiredoxin
MRGPAPVRAPVRLAALTALILLTALAGSGPAAAEGVDELLGQRPPEWTVTRWMNSPPLTLESLRGRVVLVRWWTAPDCPYCRASAPALNDLHRRYRDQGLVVLGFYHHKSAAPLDPEEVAARARELGFEFPVAIDDGWRTLRRWWLDRVPTGWTSATFVLDRDGVVRHIHPGGQYVAGDRDHAALLAAIEQLLAEPAPAARGRRP